MKTSLALLIGLLLGAGAVAALALVSSPVQSAQLDRTGCTILQELRSPLADAASSQGELSLVLFQGFPTSAAVYAAGENTGIAQSAYADMPATDYFPAYQQRDYLLPPGTYTAEIAGSSGRYTYQAAVVAGESLMLAVECM